MKKSIFLNIFRGENEYLLHSTLHGTMIKAKCSVTRDVVDLLDSLDELEYSKDNDFHVALKKLNMLVDSSVDEYELLGAKFAEIQNSSLSVTLIVTHQCNFRCVYCYEKFSDSAMTKDSYSAVIDAITREVGAKNISM